MIQDITIRLARGADVKDLIGIYAPYVENTAVTFEYEVPSPSEFLARMERVLEKYPYLIAECEGEIVGYAYGGPFHNRPAYGWAAETTVYVRQDKKKQGIGKKLYDTLELLLKEQGILNLNACIADPEREDEYLKKDSIAFHERLGYQFVGRFHNCGYKFKRWYHMVWMEKQIGEHIKDQPPVLPFPAVREKIERKYGIK